jgi:hypothetical protein
VGAGEEHEDVAGIWEGECFAADIGHAFPEGCFGGWAAAAVVLWGAGRAVEDVDGVGAATGFEGDGVGEVVGEAGGFEGGGHDDDAEIRACGVLEIEAAGEGDIDGEAAFVEFIEDDGADAGEGGFVLEPALEDAVGEEEDAGIAVEFGVVADGVSDFVADLGFAEFGDPSGEEACGHAAGFDDEDAAFDSGIDEHAGDGGGFAGTGGGFEEDAGAIRGGDGLAEGVADFVDGKGHWRGRWFVGGGGFGKCWRWGLWRGGG